MTRSSEKAICPFVFLNWKGKCLDDFCFPREPSYSSKIQLASHSSGRSFSFLLLVPQNRFQSPVWRVFEGGFSAPNVPNFDSNPCLPDNEKKCRRN